MGICYLVCPCKMERAKIKLADGDYVIAVDDGYSQLDKYGIKADIAVGDFDSLGYVPQDCPTLVHPVRKDDTDTFLAFRHAYEKGYRTFVILGGSGGERADHTLANISLLIRMARSGARGYLVGEGHSCTVIKNSDICFSKRGSGNISVFSCLPVSCGVCESGLSYTISGGELFYDTPMGVSNSFIGECARISVKDGELLIYWQTDVEKLIETVKENEKKKY